MALTQTKSIFHEYYIQLLQSWKGFGVHLLWLRQGLFIFGSFRASSY